MASPSSPASSSAVAIAAAVAVASDSSKMLSAAATPPRRIHSDGDGLAAAAAFASPASPADLSDAEASSSSASPPIVSEVDPFTPVLSKSAKRRAARKMGEALRAEALYASASPATAYRVPLGPHHAVGSAASSPASHMLVHHAPRRPSPSVTHSPSPLPALRELFPSMESSVLEAVFDSCGRSFEATAEYLLSSHDASQRDDQQMQAALSASLASAARDGDIDPEYAASAAAALAAVSLNGNSVGASPPPGPDHLSALSSDLFSLVTECLNSFDLARLGGVSRDARGQVDQVFARIERVDLGRYGANGWSDWRMLRMIARFPSLTSLSFRNTQFASFRSLGPAVFGRRLTHLSVAGNPRVHDESLQEIFGLGETIQSLDMSSCDNLTDDGLEFLATAQHNTALAKLVLNDCRHITSSGINRVLERCTGVTQLDLKGTHVTRAILSFPQSASKLRSLNLSTCKKLAAELSISSPFCTLTSLNLSSNPNLKALSLAIPTLRNLNCSNSKHLQSLALYTPALETLQLNGCLLLSTIGPVVSHCANLVLPRLHEVNLNLCRSVSSMSFELLFRSGAGASLRELSLRGCLLLGDAQIGALLTAQEAAANILMEGSSVVAAEGEGSASSSAAAASAANFVSGSRPLCALEALDLSGCKAASPSVLAAASSLVRESNVRRERSRCAEAQADALPRGWGSRWTAAALASSAVARGRHSSAEEDEHSGGLDDDSDVEPLDA